jgi:hypothetical protein
MGGKSGRRREPAATIASFDPSSPIALESGGHKVWLTEDGRVALRICHIETPHVVISTC